MSVVRFAIIGCALGVLAAAAPARAYHTERTPTIQGTAFMLQKNEWLVGPFQAGYGALGNLMISTYVVPWLTLFPNLQVKMGIFRSDRWAVAIRPGFYYADFTLPRKIYGIGPDNTDLKLWVIPIEGYVSTLIRERFMLTAAGVYNIVTGTGTYNPDNFRGTAAASNAQAGLSFQWAIDRVFALIFTARLIVFQDASGIGQTVIDVDDRTTATVRASVQTDFLDATQGLSASAALMMSWQHLNLRVGIGYGNYNVPGLNLVVPDRLPFPVFDLFWRLGGPVRESPWNLE